MGRRIYKSSASGTSIYAYDGDNLVEETNSSGVVVARYAQTQNIDEPLVMLRGGAASFYNADGLGSVTSLTNSSGAAAETYTYDSFGKQTVSAGSLVNPFQYTGREFDAETGLYYYRARYYDSTTGRFLSEDPIGFTGGDVNTYRYVQNSPVNFTDPVGLATVINNSGSPVLVSGNPGGGHGTAAQPVYAVIPPMNGTVYGGPKNGIPGYSNITDALNAYYHNGPAPKSVGTLYDVDFYAPTPVTPNTPAKNLDCSEKIQGDDEGPNYILTKNKKKGQIEDSLDSSYDWLRAAYRRIFGN
jgi:RHS repeat-associated protein